MRRLTLDEQLNYTPATLETAVNYATMLYTHILPAVISGAHSVSALTDLAQASIDEGDVEWGWFLRGVADRRAGLPADVRGQYAGDYRDGYREGCRPLVDIGESGPGLTGRAVIVNAISLNMLDASSRGASFVARRCEARTARRALDMAATVENGIGHADIAALAGAALGWELAPVRSSTLVNPGDLLIVAQYVGPRLPEGATALPEGARVDWFVVVIA